MSKATLSVSVIALAALATAAFAAPKPPKAHVTPAQAKAIAVKKVPGKATTAKYEFEDGHWQYGVLVNGKHGGLYEVEIDATTGKVTDTEKTSAAEEKSEAAADKKAAAQGKTAKPAEKDESGEKSDAGEGKG